MTPFKNVIIICFSLMTLLTESDLFKLRYSSIIFQKMRSLFTVPCIFEKMNPVVISSDFGDFIHDSLRINKTIPTIRIDHNFEISNDSAMFLPKLPTYILSTNELQTVLQKIKSTSWWNIDSRFFIVELSNRCDNAWSVLQILWKMNLLSSLFICQDTDDSLALYTYNPYANYAPYPWKNLETPFNELGQQWTLFKRFDSTGQYNCDSLFFDKTKLLNGHEVVAGAIVRLNVSTEFGKVYNISSIIEKMPILTSKSFQEIFTALNVTPIVYYTHIRNPQNIENQTIDRFFDNLADDTFDITLNFFTILNNSDTYSFIYPRLTGIYCILTPHNKVSISLDEISSIFNTDVIVLTVLIFIMTFIVIILCKRTSIDSGLLEILRLILSIGTPIKFYRHSLRIFIASVLFFVIILNANYQGKMSAYSTKQYREKINSIADLKKYQYSIFMTRYIAEILDEDWTERQRIYVHIREDHCHDYVSGSINYHTACITTASISLLLAIEHNLHAPIINTQQFVGPLVRNDWPLKSQVEVIMSRLSESGLLYFWKSFEIDEPIKKLKRKEGQKYDTYRKIIISDLGYIFSFLAASLAISFIVFVVEICIPRLRAHRT